MEMVLCNIGFGNVKREGANRYQRDDRTVMKQITWCGCVIIHSHVPIGNE